MDERTERYMTTVKLGPKGQVVIPKEIRTMYGLQPGDSLLIMADKERGIGLQTLDYLERLTNAMFQYPPASKEEEEPGIMQHFKDAVQSVIEKGEVEE